MAALWSPQDKGCRRLSAPNEAASVAWRPHGHWSGTLSRSLVRCFWSTPPPCSTAGAGRLMIAAVSAGGIVTRMGRDPRLPGRRGSVTWPMPAA